MQAQATAPLEGMLAALLFSGDNPLVSEWRRQVGQTETMPGPRIADGDPFSVHNWQPYMRFSFDQPLTPDIPDPIPEDPTVPTERNGGDGGGDGLGRDFQDIRSPGFWGIDGFPGKKEGQWLDLPTDTVVKDLLNSYGTWRGGFLGNLLGGNRFSTYESIGGQAAIEEAAKALGVDVNQAKSAIEQALGYGMETEAPEGLLGGLLGGMTPLAGMMLGTTPMNENLFNNILNERATIAGVMGALANPQLDFGAFMPSTDNPYGSPRTVSDFLGALSKSGYDVGQTVTDPLEAAGIQSALDTWSNLAAAPPYAGFMAQLPNLSRQAGVLGQLTRGEGLNSADAGRIAGSITDPATDRNFKETLSGWAKGEISTEEMSKSLERMQENKEGLKKGKKARDKDRGGGDGSDRGGYDGSDDPGRGVDGMGDDTGGGMNF